MIEGNGLLSSGQEIQNFTASTKMAFSQIAIHWALDTKGFVSKASEEVQRV